MSAQIKHADVTPPVAAFSYNVDGAAKNLGISRSTVWRFVQAGELHTFKLGGRTLIRADELQAFIDRKSRAA